MDKRDIPRGPGSYEAKDGDTCGACGATMGNVAVHAAWHLQVAPYLRAGVRGRADADEARGR